ncbi:hypothetical protein UFOVP206_59 [uncultured Caudovirales phage]|uniref:Uncharacterized protein n=1 Tax=uncultured Caudovirales phage TaxID=2100421 RepID=A0A6J7WJX2_9CAUD|nr:hypothetical protein UFOVP206_59 [uncultured Caudovirales phage]
MTKEHQRISLVMIGCLPILKDYLEEIVPLYPNLFDKGLKKSINDVISEINKNQNNIYSDSYDKFIDKIKRQSKKDKEYLRQLFKKDRVNQYFKHLYKEDRFKRMNQHNDLSLSFENWINENFKID